MSSIGNLGDMIADMKAGVFDYTNDGECSNCGQCCGNYLPLSKSDIKRIKEYVSANQIKEQIRCYPTANAILDFQCPFRDEINKKCTIYPVRPMICRDFKCDKPRKNIEIDKARYHEEFGITDMRAEFFGGKSVFLSAMEAMMFGGIK